jgi:hypothetical protein
VINPASADNKKLINAATSFAVPKRPMGTIEAAALATSAAGIAFMKSSVSMAPGATAFTVMPYSAKSKAQVRVQPMMALLAAA